VPGESLRRRLRPKIAISHRGRAPRALAPVIAELLGR